MNIIRIVGIVLFVVGAIVLIMGAYDLITFNNSTVGKISNKLAGFAGTKTEAVKNSIIQMSIGAVCLVVDVVLYKKG
jgi:hypothetical protein